MASLSANPGTTRLTGEHITEGLLARQRVIEAISREIVSFSIMLHVSASGGRWSVALRRESLARPGSISMVLMQQLFWLNRV